MLAEMSVQSEPEKRVGIVVPLIDAQKSLYARHFIAPRAVVTLLPIEDTRLIASKYPSDIFLF